MNSEPSVNVEAPPAERISLAVERFGEAEVAKRSIALLAGFNVGDEFLLFAGGTHAQGILDGAPPLYWPEVWGARALLSVWSGDALVAVRAGLTNQAWRVREMCARVVATRGLPLAEDIRTLLADDNSRVRASAARTLGEVGDADDTERIANLFSDPEIEVRRSAGSATKRLKARFAPAE